MNQVRLLLLLGALASATVANAAPSEQTQACVAASTQGQTDRDEGRLLAAREQLLACAHEACPSIVKKSCGAWLAELDARIPSVVVRVHDAGQRDLADAVVRLDGRSIALDGRSIALDPGTHMLSVDVQGGRPVERSFLVVEREQGRLLVVALPTAIESERAAPAQSMLPAGASLGPTPSSARVARPKPERSSPTRARFAVPSAAWALGGLGLVGVVSFVAVRSKAKSDLDELLRTCAPTCADSQRDAGHRKTLAADVSLGIGVAALAGAGAWTLGSWIAERRAARTPPVALSLGPAKRGAFAVIEGRY